MTNSKTSSADEGAILGEVRPFPCRPADESVYCYPHSYRIDYRKTHMGTEQRHVWLWNGGKTETEAWIPSPVALTTLQTMRKRVSESVRDLCDLACTPRSYLSSSDGR